ncbi:hypothetical protein AS888_02625 [Peribacillus simplex]|uniref:Uncharacterized protein n=1 Tax=Peribacillus simplex TaxID=1478 RepID=A0A109MSN6_9BACI|nr:hypothetical protein AS888_02625 [Peribacillus simplex]
MVRGCGAFLFHREDTYPISIPCFLRKCLFKGRMNGLDLKIEIEWIGLRRVTGFIAMGVQVLREDMYSHQ